MQYRVDASARSNPVTGSRWRDFFIRVARCGLRGSSRCGIRARKKNAYAKRIAYALDIAAVAAR
jgi:hypothetical protein